MQKLSVGSCFSGIGGLELGLEWTGGFETKWQIEIDPNATKVLEKHWPEAEEWRFCEETDAGWFPSDRFPIEHNWSKNRLKILKIRRSAGQRK